jgi:hypothetical protein
MSSIEDIEEYFDKFVLSIFEAARNHEAARNEESSEIVIQEKSNELLMRYDLVKSAILNLKGIDSTPQTNSQKITNLKQQYVELRSEIFDLGKDLDHLSENIDLNLNQVKFYFNFDSYYLTYALFSSYSSFYI